MVWPARIPPETARLSTVCPEATRLALDPQLPSNELNHLPSTQLNHLPSTQLNHLAHQTLNQLAISSQIEQSVEAESSISCSWAKTCKVLHQLWLCVDSCGGVESNLPISRGSPTIYLQ